MQNIDDALPASVALEMRFVPVRELAGTFDYRQFFTDEPQTIKAIPVADSAATVKKVP